VSFAESKWDVKSLMVRCNKCVGCRRASARGWAIRCLHESRLHASNSFVTLTLEDGSEGAQRTLDHRQFQLFAKRLRKQVQFRYFMCGEYGPSTLRPHYHALLFGVAPDEELASSCWQLGHVKVGEVEGASVSYVTGYLVKDSPSPEGAVPPYRKMSRRPGLGAEYFEKYRGDFSKDFALWRGSPVAMPTYYRRKFSLEELEWLDHSRDDRRLEMALEDVLDSYSWERQRSGELVAESLVHFQKRGDP